MATRKQIRALARGRGLRTQKIINRYVSQAEELFNRWKSESSKIKDENIKRIREAQVFNRRKFINKLRDTQEIQNLSLREAFEETIRTAPYLSIADNYIHQIQVHINKAELRSKIAKALGQDYQHTSIPDWDLWSLNEDLYSTILPNGTTVTLRLVAGVGSDDPDFVEVTVS